ncbi:MAG: glycosyltransferase [Acidobacteria bacterium]|nr:glycosyltransferase [Acidobacteriota bacterium]
MRILKVSEAYYPFLEKGGPTVKVRAIARGLAQRGHQVTVLTADLGFENGKVKSEAAERSRWGWRAERDGVEAIYLRGRGRYRALTFNPGVLGFCRQRLSEFDLVHIYGLYDLLGPAVARSCRCSGIPYVIEPMGMFRPIVRNLWLKRFYHLVLGGELMRGARRVIATAVQERHELVEGGVPEAKIAVRRNGIDVPDRLPEPGSFRFHYQIPAEMKLVLFLGRLVSKKSPELLAEAFAAWQRQAGQAEGSRLVLAGPDEGDGYRQKLETFAARLGLTAGVLFTGPLYEDAKWAAYRDADVFVLPSQNENFGNTAAEAIACGTPVIVTDRCGIAPLVDQRAGLVVPYNLGALQAGLARLLGDEALRLRLQAGCREVARALAWDEPLAMMENIYQEVVAEGQRK